MTIQTNPVFYYVDGITKDNNLLNFREPSNAPGLELTALLKVGSRSMTDLSTEIERGLNDAGQETYTVTFDRDTRIMTVACTDTFELLVASGSNLGSDPFSLMGFTGADLTGAVTYDGDSAMGSEYLTQFKPQKFKSFANNKEGVQASVNESAAGIVEVITFGSKRLMEMELLYITDRFKSKGGPIENNSTGLQDAIDFMDFLITKSNVEFMEDRTSRSTFTKVLIERTRKSRQGTSYEIDEMLNKGLEDYFSTGTLIFRKVE